MSITLMPFLYPRITRRQLTSLLNLAHLPKASSHDRQCRRLKATLTPAAARLLLANELPILINPPAPPTHVSTDHRTPPFLDTLTLTVHSGPGGHGCVSFLREKFISHGPPNGGDGGSGGDVYITIDHQMSSLHKLSRLKVVKAGRGMNGMGGNRNGRRGEDVVLKVPPGTILRVLERGDGSFLPSQMVDDMDGEEEDELIIKGTQEEVGEIDYSKIRKRIPRRFAKSNIDDPESDWIHYPLSLAANLNSPHWPPQKPVRREVVQPDVLKVDFSPAQEAVDGASGSNANLGGITGSVRAKGKHVEPILLLKGGAGGYGNPSFITKENRRPMWATKGSKGSVMKIQLELKLLADVGLVGRPNVGKSSLLRCVTGSRARVGNWAFTTIKPNMGTVVLDKGVGVSDLIDGDEAGTGRERFTIADIPGLVRDAGDNKGLGWDFLRHVERARGLVFIVDLGFDPVRQVEGLWRDIRGYERMREVERQKAEEEEKILREKRIKEDEEAGGEYGAIISFEEDGAAESNAAESEGISGKPWMVIGNKADLEGAEQRFGRLKEHLENMTADGTVSRPIGCVAVSALKAGRWADGEYEREEQMWKGVVGWFRNLVN
ncbi:hypothetical protein ABW19_dt0203400 [Dactylella cylindrospora]|nr:hypothetical protein ABW19_dt0203400 [Dactylella cylindrospora]